MRNLLIGLLVFFAYSVPSMALEVDVGPPTVIELTDKQEFTELEAHSEMTVEVAEKQTNIPEIQENLMTNVARSGVLLYIDPGDLVRTYKLLFNYTEDSQKIESKFEAVQNPEKLKMGAILHIDPGWCFKGDYLKD